MDDYARVMAINLRSPEPTKADLGVTAFFPVQQTLKGLAAARAGETTLEILGLQTEDAL